jgi:hypothetical protein
MKFLLIITFAFQGKDPVSQPVGVLIDEDTCKVAGIGMTLVLKRANPGLDAGWACLPQGVAA